MEQRWREDAVEAMLADEAAGALFVAGCASNQGRYRDRFDALVLLSVPREVLLERLARRTTNHFGKTESERQRILADLEEVEPLLRATATEEIVTTMPVECVADRLETLAATHADAVGARRNLDHATRTRAWVARDWSLGRLPRGRGTS